MPTSTGSEAATTSSARSRSAPVRVLAAVITPAALVAVLLSQPGVAPSVVRAVGHAHPVWLFGAVAAEAGSMAAFVGLHRRALRTAGVGVRRRTVAAIAFASNAISSSIPLIGSLAGTTNTWRQYHRRGAPAPAVIWALGVSGVASTVALTIVMAVGATASGNPAIAGAGAAGTVVVLVIAAVLVVGARLPAFRARLEDSVTAVVTRVPGRSHRRSRAERAWLVRNLIEQLGSYRPTLGDMSFALSAGVLNWVLDALTLAFAIRAAGGHVPVTDLIIIWAAAGTASSLSITPSGIGVVEPVLAAGLVLAGLPHATAIAATLLYRSISLVLVVAVGWAVQWSMLRAAPLPTPLPPSTIPKVSRCRSHTRPAGRPRVPAPVPVTLRPAPVEEPVPAQLWDSPECSGAFLSSGCNPVIQSTGRTIWGSSATKPKPVPKR